MEIKVIQQDFSVCQVPEIPDALLRDEYCFVGKTDQELSLVCKTDGVPENTIAREDGWKAFRIEGVLDFSMIGVIARISSILAEHEIGIFVVSTYNTDYVLTREKDFERAIHLLNKSGYHVV